jgi:hypothetical protein
LTRPSADQPVRGRVGHDFDTTFLVEAGAGTRKTTVLLSRALALVETGRATLDRIVAITFTEKAAGELKLRLREGIEDALDKAKGEEERQRLRTAATDLVRTPVSTIHAFVQALPEDELLSPASGAAWRRAVRSGKVGRGRLRCQPPSDRDGLRALLQPGCEGLPRPSMDKSGLDHPLQEVTSALHHLSACRWHPAGIPLRTRCRMVAPPLPRSRVLETQEGPRPRRERRSGPAPPVRAALAARFAAFLAIWRRTCSSTAGERPAVPSRGGS